MQAVVLKKNVFAEANEIITFYSRELGKVRGVARAVKLAKSKLAFGLQTLFLDEIDLAGSRSTRSITGVKVLNAFKNIRESQNAATSAMYAVELVMKSTPDEQPNAGLFDYLVSYLEHLDREGSGGAGHNCAGVFAFGALALEGSGIKSDACAACGKPFSAGSEDSDIQIYFSPSKGGFLCSSCASSSADSFPVAEGPYCLRALESFDLADQRPQAGKSLLQAAGAFSARVLERDLKSGRFLV